MKSEKTGTIDPDREKDTYTSEVRLELLKAVTEKGKLFRFKAPGFSMHPFIRHEDIITVAPLPAGGPVPGDIVAFVRPDIGKLIVHRVIAKTDDGYLIKGDNTENPDGIIPAANILAIVVRVEHKGKNKVVTGIGFGRKPIASLSRSGNLRKITVTISRFKWLCGAGLQKAQKFVVYRRLAGMLRPEITIVEADEQDMNDFHARWNYHPAQPPYRPDPLVTHFVAKRGEEIVGFVELVRHPESHYPYTGHWLFSLMVRIPSRGMGLGRELSARVIDMAEQEGAPEVSLLVRETNKPAITLYRQLQFEPVTIPGLEEQLEEEYASTGKRRIAMRRVSEKNTRNR